MGVVVFRKEDAWVWLFLALPFAVAVILLDGLHTAIRTFHGSDETIFHLPAILNFAAQWPVPSLQDYSSATTPLFHLMFAALGQAVGFEIHRLRSVNVLISLLAGVVCYRLWRREAGLRSSSSLLLALAFQLSPYFFGVAFLLLTDNLAWLLCLLSMSAFLAALRTGSATSWAMGALFLSLCLLTRQSFVWLLLAAAGMACLRQPTFRGLMSRLAVLALAAVPLIGLVTLWKGLTPPSFQTIHEATGFLNPRALTFGLAVTGLYGCLLRAEDLAAWMKQTPTSAAAAALCGLVLLAVSPIGRRPDDDGFVWRIAHQFPDFVGSSVALWLLVPLGCLVFALLLQTAWKTFGFLALIAFFAAAMPSQLVFQKYFDPFIPLLLMLARPVAQDLTRLQHVSLALMILAFLTYPWVPYLWPAY